MDRQSTCAYHCTSQEFIYDTLTQRVVDAFRIVYWSMYAKESLDNHVWTAPAISKERLHKSQNRQTSKALKSTRLKQLRLGTNMSITSLSL